MIILHWILFSLSLLFFPLAYYLNNTHIKREPPSALAKEKYNYAIFTLFWWSNSFFYMGIFTNILIIQYIFGIVSILLCFTNLANIWTNSKSTLKSILIIELLVGVGITIFLIYQIPSSYLRGIVVPVVASLYGGLLTLFGVAWTINDNNKKTIENHKRSIRPVFSYLGEISNVDEVKIKNLVLFDNDFPHDGYGYAQLFLRNFHNSSKVEMYISEANHSGKSYVPRYPVLVGKDESFKLELRTHDVLNMSQELIRLRVTDIEGNDYFWDIHLILKTNQESKKYYELVSLQMDTKNFK